MTNFQKKIFVSPDQNLSAGDVNLIGALADQNTKNFNRYILSENDCVISGLEVFAPPPSGNTVTVKPGFAIYASPTATTTVQYSNPSLSLSYQGAIVEIDSNVGVTITTPDLTQIRYDAIDLIYTEYQAVPSTRNFIDPGTGTVSPQSTNTQTVSNTVNNPGSPNTNIIYTQGTPGAGFPSIPANCIRLAIIQVNPSGIGAFNITQNNITQSGSTGTSGSGGTLPRIWDLQSFPTNSTAVAGPAINTSDQSNSLSDSLSAIRYQLNQIITTGNGSWYKQIPISLPQLLIWAGNDTGSANNYAVSIANFPPSLSAGLRILFVATNGNSGASTVAVNGGSPIGIKDSLGNDIQASSIQPNQRVLLFYDGTFWIMPYLNVGIQTPPPFTIPNGSFEVWNGTTPQSWTIPVLTGSATVSQDTANSIDGTSALKISIPAGFIGNATTTSSLITIGPQNSYYIKFKTNASQSAILGSVQVTFYDSTKTIIGTATNLWAPIGGVWPISWTTYYGILLDNNSGSYVIPTNVFAPQIPSNARYFSITLAAGINTSIGSTTNIWFDGFQFFDPGKSSVVFNTSTNGTYNIITPGNAIKATITLIGAGGGGGGSTISAGQFSGGGGGQGGTLKAQINVFPDTQYTVIVGKGGSGGGPVSGNPGTPGNPGGNTQFKLNSTVLMQANGGSGGGSGGSPNTGPGGPGGSWSFPFGNTVYIINAVNGGAGTNGSVIVGQEADGGSGGTLSLAGNPFLSTNGGSQKSQDHGGGTIANSGSGAGGCGAANGSVNPGGQSGIDGAVLIEF